MTANQLIAALQSCVASNANVDVPLMFQVNGAHAAGDKMSSVSSVIYAGPTIMEAPGSPTVQVAAVCNILLP